MRAWSTSGSRPTATRRSVTVVHRHFSRHGEGAADYEAAMNSGQGWPLLLERFAGTF